MTTDHYSRKFSAASLNRGERSGAFSLTEMLIVIAVIGVIAAIAVPTVTNVRGAAGEAKSRMNAQRVATVSNTLAGMGVAHVIPQSMGGVEATIRLLSEGVTVTHEVMSESRFSVPILSDEEVTAAAEYLEIILDTEELRLVYLGSGDEPPVAVVP